jgi:hypothetical protein
MIPFGSFHPDLSKTIDLAVAQFGAEFVQTGAATVLLVR